MECGQIQGGRCHGDLIWGTGLYRVNNDRGCIKGGIYQNRAIKRQISIVGKCSSRCSLGSSIITYSELVYNGGQWATDPDSKQLGFGLIEEYTNETVTQTNTTPIIAESTQQNF